MILSYQDILVALDQGDIKISPLSKEFIQAASLDLTLASTIRVFDPTAVEYIDIKSWMDPSKEIEIKESFLLYPDDFILGSTVENITLPNYISGRLEGRSSLGRLGLLIQASAGYISPGFSGTLTLEIKNISRIPLKLYPGIRIAQIIFELTSSPTLKPYGSANSNNKYQNQKKPIPSMIWSDFNYS